MNALPPLTCAALTMAILAGGAYLAAVIDVFVGRLTAGRPIAGALFEPLRSAAMLARQKPAFPAPDQPMWILAPAAYAAAAAVALAVVPLGEAVAIADVGAGVALFAGAEVAAFAAILLYGWSPSSQRPLIGGSRFVAVALTYGLVSMFALIAASLPAGSLQVSAIVASQTELWNVIRQPLGLPLWLVVTLGVTFTGPLDLATGSDLDAADTSGRQLLVWRLARGAMLTAFCGMGAAIFLGGWLGPLLAGWLWMLLKTAALMVAVAALRHLYARMPAERAVLGLWTIGLPLALLHVLWAAVQTAL